MKTENNNNMENVTPTRWKFLASFSQVPLLSWLLGALIAVVLERYIGLRFAWALKLPKIPALFGSLVMIKTPQLIPSVLLYVIVIYVLPIGIVARLSASLANKLAAKLLTFPLMISTVIHLTILYATLHLWAGVSDYRLLVLKLILIAIMLTLSLNIINGYMGEFSCSHPGFMAIGAYVASVFTLALFINGGFFETRYKLTGEAFEQLRNQEVQEEVLENLQILQDQTIVGKEAFLKTLEEQIGAKQTTKYRRKILKQAFAPPLLPEVLGPALFPIGLILGGLVASVGALAVAIPSFRTRGDYLAIISLAFMFIVKSLIENLEIVGGPRGLGGQPNYATLPVVFLWTVACVWVINNFVRSTKGKALNAVRDNYMAADAMTVNSKNAKFMAFLFAAFWAGVAGGLFAHVIRYVNPGTFDIKKLAEVLAMVYFGGLNSTYGSIVGAVSISLLGEALRPLEIFKWIIIPLLLILVIIYRPTGLIAFKELRIEHLLKPKTKPENEV
jgi:ABC-type branched-subunit amino acid transport system permease subunit